MRLCVATWTYPHVGEPWVHEPVEWLRARGHQVEVLAAEQGAIPETPASRFPCRVVEPWIPRPLKLRIAARHPLRIIQAAGRLRTARLVADRWERWDHICRAAVLEVAGADVLLVHFGDLGALWLEAARLARVPLAVFFHGHDATARPWQQPDAYRSLTRSDALLLTNGEYMRGRLLAFGARPERTGVVGYAAGCGLMTTPPAPLETPRILSIARLVPKKGLADSIAAFATAGGCARRWTYDIVGRGPLGDALRAQANASGVATRVRFRGILSRTRVRDALINASVFVLASRTAPDGDTEGTPVALIEAAALGLPIVTTAHAGIPEILPPDAAARGFMVPEGDVAGLRRAIERLAASVDLRREWGGCCRDWVRRSRSPEAYVSALLDSLPLARVP